MNNIKLLLTIFLLFICVAVLSSVNADSKSLSVEGVLGLPEKDRELSFYCMTTDAGKIKYKQVVDLVHLIRKDKIEYCKSLSKDSFKTTVHADERKNLLKLRSNNNKKQEYNDACSIFIDKVKNDDMESFKPLLEKEKKLQQMVDSLRVEAKAYSDGNPENVDVPYGSN